MLDNTIILAHPGVYTHNSKKDDANDEEANHLVEERPVRHDNSAIVERLPDSVILGIGTVPVVRPAAQDGEFLIQIPVQKGQQRDDGKDNARGQ